VLAIDHLIVTVADLDTAARRLQQRYGLASRSGGRHPGHGTGNRIIPLGADYLELMAVVDAAEAAASPLGRWVAARTRHGDAPAALCLRTDDISGVAARLGEPPQAMSRLRPDGRRLSWRLAGLEAALSREAMPFFIQWDVAPDEHPGREPASHTVHPAGIAWVEVGVRPEALDARLGPNDLDLRPVPGSPGPGRFGIALAPNQVIIVDDL